MIEAMACGTPVIAFGCGSVPEVVDHAVTGFIVDIDRGGGRRSSRAVLSLTGLSSAARSRRASPPRAWRETIFGCMRAAVKSDRPPLEIVSKG